ncbi:condensation domain-containing protein [Micromonospora pisi]|uniref:Condensation domain-containing protein n=1 Tax=Micromonospora pisi TaxID=589240 RepID=A0A495JXE4_9ACTN|nr:condensation domain-containing protein [Micromonospora pisi]RKR92934.1 condensation domain-containing protein [Micromonospora pisi]
MTSETLPVEFRAGERWSGPLTWGQLAIWDVVRWLPPGDASLNLLRVCDVPAGRTTGEVADALRRLVERHEVLRTRFTRPENPEPRQTVEPHGRLDVALVETDGRAREGVMDELVSRLRSRPFDLAAELPLRAAVVTADNAPVAVVLVFNHMAVDGYSVEIVGRDLRLLLTDGGDLPLRALQPRGRIAYEASDPARRRARQALEYWADGIRELPGALLAPDPGPERRQWARITSGALRLALRELANRHRMSLSMLVQALTGLLLGFYRHESRVGIRLIVATRFTAETRDYVGAFNQNGLLRLSLGAEPLAEFLGRARMASMRAYQYCECDPLLLEERIEAICAERGFGAGAYCFFNDVRSFDEVRSGDRGAVGGGHDGEGGPDLLGRIETARQRTRVTALDRDGRQKDAKFFLFLNTLVGEARLTLATDGRFLAPGSAQTFLADLEWLAIEAVSHDRTLPELAAAWSRRQR